ncbi:MAG: N-6 DNA methylase [Thermoanaerobacteraceae bacterium]|nr:N-6 DNA methylase [Thermoanaerobacteraceae bacterium]
MVDMNSITEVTYKISDHMRGIVRPEEANRIILGIFTIKWINDTKERFGWHITGNYSWDDIRVHNDGVKGFLMYAARGLEEDNYILKGIFTDYLFERLQDVDDAAVWMVINNIDRLDLNDNEVAASFVEWYIKQSNTWGNIMTESQFTSPDIISQLLVELVDVKSKQSLCDICSGVGGTAVEAVKMNPSLMVYGQEINKNAFYLSKINLLLHGHYDFRIELGDVIKAPALVENGMLINYDAVVSDLPFNVFKWGYETAAADKYGRFKYGVTPSMSSDWVFIQHVIAVTKETGIAAVVTSRGSLAKTTDEKIRAGIVEDDIIEAVIDLPHKLYEGTSIPVSIIVFNKNKPAERRNKVLMIDASNEFIANNRRTNTLSDEQKQKLLSVFRNGEEIEKYSSFIDVAEIKKNGYKLGTINYLKINALAVKMKNAVKLKDVTKSIFRGAQINSKEIDELQKAPDADYYLLNVGNIQDGQIDMSSMVKIALKSQRWASFYLLEPGDVVISARGSSIKTAVIDEGMPPTIVAGNLVCIRVNRKKVNPYYLKIFLDSPVGHTLLEGVQTGSVIKVLNPKNIEEIPVPLIDIDKQKELADAFISAKQRYIDIVTRAEQEFEATLTNIYQKMGVE